MTEKVKFMSFSNNVVLISGTFFPQLVICFFILQHYFRKHLLWKIKYHTTTIGLRPIRNINRARNLEMDEYPSKENLFASCQ